ncbi:hypothetical protein [Calothrix sp. CCY 0018]
MFHNECLYEELDTGILLAVKVVGDFEVMLTTRRFAAGNQH